MKSRLVLISAILAAIGTGVAGNALSAERDAQAQAAALLSGQHTSASAITRDQGNTSSQAVTLDAQAHAAALLSGARVKSETDTTVQTAPRTAQALDAQAHAAALLSGTRITTREVARTTATNEKLGQHPAVLVAQSWSSRGIDPSTFIVAHPARLQLIATSPSDESQQVAQTKVVVTGAAGR